MGLCTIRVAAHTGLAYLKTEEEEEQTKKERVRKGERKEKEGAAENVGWLGE